MACQFGFAQATPAPFSLLENEQAYRLKIGSIDGLIAALVSNEDRRKQYSPFESEPCTMVTRAFNNWWNAYYKRFIRPYDVIKAGADKLLATDQPQRPKPAPKRKAEPTSTSKKATNKTKSEKALTSTNTSKAKPSTMHLAPTPPTTQNINPEPSTIRSDASSGTKNSEEAHPSPRKLFEQGKSKATLIITKSASSDSASTQSKVASPIQHRAASPAIDSKRGDGKSTEIVDEGVFPESSSDTSIEENRQVASNPSSPQDSDNLLLDLNSLVAELHKVASDTVLENTIPSDSINKSMQQPVQTGAAMITTEPVVERPATLPNKYNMSKEIIDALRWLIDLLSARVEESIDHDEVQKKTQLVAAHFHAHLILEEAAPIKAVPLLVKNLLNTAWNAKKCQDQVVNLGKDIKILDKSTTDYTKVKDQLSDEIGAANEKLSALQQQKTRLEEELASIQQRINDVEEQKKRLANPLNRSKDALSKIDGKLATIAKKKGN
ncbi:hypothetical protein PIB30_008543 [Stylosanthes scabra]|uniref:Uncharacterized protein n=1 Tax=Stylosanthes scabra TaxID=79078 RepID=A0ABU6Z1Q5_9FABA|nr:hypothetical protein [Stylosanthes scabra]